MEPWLNPVTPTARYLSQVPVNSTLHCDANVLGMVLQVVVYLMYGAVFLVSLVGNTLVVMVVMCSPRMRTTTNYWLLNLAVGDILMTLLCVPFTFISTLILQYWPFGVHLCHVVSSTNSVPPPLQLVFTVIF